LNRNCNDLLQNSIAELRFSSRELSLTVTTVPSKTPRRNFIEAAALALLAAFFAAMWMLRQWYRSRPNPSRRVARAGEIPAGGS
jgi:ferric-dicitrate binding protein FerR (iron transport regulator)